MKIAIILINFLIVLACKNSVNQTTIAQEEIKLSGKVICPDTVSNLEILAVNFVQDKPDFDQAKLLFNQKSDTFNITIEKEVLSNYTHIYMMKGMYEKYEKTSDLSGNYKEYKLDKSLEYIVKKPAIYLYPTEKTEVKIIHDFKGTIKNTYPEYHNGWKVVAYPDGKLIDLTDNRTHNYLFWDGVYNFPKEHFNFDSGFVVKSENTISFLQEKLEAIGLNQTEINDFIVFWLPEMSDNPYNFIHFSINDYIDNSSFLYVDPKPETEIRIFMEFYGVNHPNVSNVPEQKINTIKRNGFTLVEWGGAKIPIDKFQIL